MKVNFRAAPDTFLWNGSNIPLQVHYRFPDGDWFDAVNSHLDIALNGRYLTSVPVLKTGVLEKIKNQFGWYTRQEQALVEVPSYLIFGQNQLDFYFNTQFAPDRDCAQVLPERALTQIDGDSRIDLTRTQHFAQLPNLSFFVGAGFPFTRMADLSEAAVLLPSTPDASEIRAMLAMLGRFGAATGYPSVAVDVLLGTTHMDVARDKDLLVVSGIDDRLDLESLLAGSAYRLDGQRLRVRSPNTWEWALTILQGDWGQQRAEADRLLSGERQFHGLVSRRSPVNPDRVMVLALASDTDWLPRIAAGLNDPSVTPEIRGDLVFFEAPERVLSYRAGEKFSYGELPWSVYLRWMFSERPLVLVVLVLVSTALIATALYPLLRAHVRRRLR